MSQRAGRYEKWIKKHYFVGVFFYFLLMILSANSFAYYPKDFTSPLTKIVFGSCNRADLPQPLWKVISENQPQLWIWVGDNIYGDTTDPLTLESKYLAQFNQPTYKVFREMIPIVGTWDDHDYGENNGDKWFPMKEKSQQLALQFFEEPVDSPRFKQKGIYTSYVFGPPDQQVKIFLLDNRYHSDRPGVASDLLGPAQWAWLERELIASKAQFNIIVSGTQILSEEHKWEKWSNFPLSRTRLFTLIRLHSISGVVFISGDRHFHEISIKDDKEVPYPFVDVTSSGLTHSWENFSDEPNQYRYRDVFSKLGFGLLSINWTKSIPEISIQIHDINNNIVNEVVYKSTELQPNL